MIAGLLGAIGLTFELGGILLTGDDAFAPRERVPFTRLRDNSTAITPTMPATSSASTNQPSGELPNVMLLRTELIQSPSFSSGLRNGLWRLAVSW